MRQIYFDHSFPFSPDDDLEPNGSRTALRQSDNLMLSNPQYLPSIYYSLKSELGQGAARLIRKRNTWLCAAMSSACYTRYSIVT